MLKRKKRGERAGRVRFQNRRGALLGLGRKKEAVATGGFEGVEGGVETHREKGGSLEKKSGGGTDHQNILGG